MKKRFTILIAALMLLVFMMPSMAGWGQTKDNVITIDFEDTSIPNGWTNSNYMSVVDNPISNTSTTNGNYCLSTNGKQNCSLTSGLINDIVSISIDAAKTSNNNTLNLYIDFSTSNSFPSNSTQTLNISKIPKNSWATSTLELEETASGYVRIRWAGSSTAIKFIDNIKITCTDGNTPTITGLSYTGTPTTTTYEAGDSFDPTGLTVTATYSDASTQDVTASVVWTPDPLTQGTTSVTGTYSGLNVTVPGITVNAPAGPDIVLNYNNSPFTATSANTNTASVTLDDIQYDSYGGYNYTNSSGSFLSINREIEGYLGNNTVLCGNIKKIVVNYSTGGASLFTMYEGATALAETTTVSPSGTGTGAITYTFSGNNGYFKFKRTTTGTNYSDYCNINSISIYLKDCDNPEITVSTNSLTGFTYVEGNGPSTAQTFTVSGTHLTADLNMSLGENSDFEISSENSGYANSITLAHSDGTVANTTIYARLKTGKDKGNYNGAITLTSTDATNKTVSLSGTVTAQLYTLSDQSGEHGSIGFSASPVEAGTHVTLTPTPVSDAYYFVPDSWSFFNESEEVTSSIVFVSGETNVIEMPAFNLLVDASFQAKPTHNITIASGIDNGTVTADPTFAYAGQTVTLTATPSEGYYLGSLTATYVDGNNETHNLTITNNTFEMPNYDVTVTATFLSNTYEGSFAKYSGDLTEGDYLIVYDNSAMNTTLSSNRFGYTSVEPSNGNIITNPSKVIVWHIAQDGDYWTIYNAKEEKYVSNSSYGSTTMALVPSISNNNGAVWQASGTETYEFRSKGNAVSYPNNARYLRKNGTSGFANYTEGYGGALTLYKLVPPTVPAWTTLPTPSIYTGNEYELTLTDYVTGYPAPNITLATEVSSSFYEYENGYFTFQSDNAGTYEFTFTATNAAGSANVTLTITVIEPAKVTCQYSINGELIDEAASITQGELITLAEAADDLNEYFTFAGWTDNLGDIENNIHTPEASYQVNDNVVFYAVYAHEVEGIPVTSYNKVSSISAGDYLIVCENSNVAFDGSRNNTTNNKIDASYNAIGVTIDEYSIASSESTDAAIFTIAAITGGYSIQSASGFYIGSDSHNNELDVNNENALLNTIEIDDDGNAVIIGYYSSSTSYTALRYNATSGQERFRYYKEASQQAIQLYKKETTTPSTTEYYTHVLVEDITQAIDISDITDPIVIPAGSVINAGSYLTNTNPANLIIEDGGQLKVYATGNRDGEVQATVEKNITHYTVIQNQGEEFTDGWYFIASPINSNALAPTDVTNMLSNAYDLYQLNNTNWENYENQEHTEGFTIDNGRGYLYANSADVTLSFAGAIKPFNKETPTANQVAVNTGWNLIGNPFTFNVYANRSYYKMNDARTGIEAVSEFSTSPIAPCTGIVVKSTGTDNVAFLETAGEWSTGNKGNIEMTLAQQATNRGNATTIDNAIVSFNEGSQLEKFYFGNPSASIFIPQNGEDYAIAFSDRQGDVPLYFKANETGTYTISFAGDEMSLNGIYLIDILAEEEIDLSVNPSYTFIGSPADRMARFKIVFRNANGDGTSDIFAYQNGNDIIVSGEGELQIFDVMGRMVSRQRVNGVETVNAMPYGVYILKLNGMTQKIVVR